MQVQAIADRLANLPVDLQPRFFQQPWASIWHAIDKAESGTEQEALYTVTSAMPDQKEILQTILGTRPGYVPTIPSLEDIGKGLPPIDWLWKGYIPRGLLTLLLASQGSGKSFVGLDFAHRIIHNLGFPDGAPIPRHGANVIYVEAENIPQVTYERAKAYGMNQTRFFPMLADPEEGIDLSTTKYQDRLTEMVHHLKPELLVIDSLTSMHTGGQNNPEDLRPMIMYLVRLAGWAGCGVLLIHHIRKPPFGNKMQQADFGIEDASGSGYITQQARVVLGLRVVQTSPEYDPNGPRELKVLKSNLGEFPKPLGFRFEKVAEDGARLSWDTEPPKPYREPTQMDSCKEWLEDTLRKASVGILVKEIISMGDEQGFNKRMIYRARRELKSHILDTRKHKAPGNAWQWSDLPILDAPDSEGESEE
jgi:KaiC/GvpD/RAD55 family RecA-like ATPase